MTDLTDDSQLEEGAIAVDDGDDLEEEPFESGVQEYATAFPPLDVACASASWLAGPDRYNGPGTVFPPAPMWMASPPVCVVSTRTEAFAVPSEERRYPAPAATSAAAAQHEAPSTCSGSIPPLSAGRQRQSVAEIAARCKVSVETFTNKDGSLNVFVTGPQGAVAEAKRLLLRALQTQIQIQVPISREYFKALKTGPNLNELEKQTSTKIHIPRPEEKSDAITITGTREGVEQAKQLLQAQVDELAKVGYERVTLDKRYHPLVCARSNAALHSLLEGKQLRIVVPPSGSGRDEIVVSGEREAVREAVTILQDTYEQMRRDCDSLSIEVAKEKHRYVIGPRWSGITEILETTGVSVEMPPLCSSANTVTLFGPKGRLGEALTLLFTRAESAKSVVIPAPAWLHKFVIGKKGRNLAPITADRPELTLSFESESHEIHLDGPPDQVDAAAAALAPLVAELEQRLSYAHVEVEPGILKQLIGCQQAINGNPSSGSNRLARLSKESGCSIELPSSGCPGVEGYFVRIEGGRRAVEQTSEALVALLNEMKNAKSKDILVEHRYLPQLIGNGGRGFKQLTGQFPLVRFNFPAPNSGLDIVGLRGPREDVDAAANWIQKRILDIADSSYCESIVIPRRYHYAIIGREGATIRELRSETHTRIDVPTDGQETVTVTGKQEDVKRAVARIQALYAKLLNQTTIEISIPPHLHTALIGRGGQRITELRESCGGQVTVRFPEPHTGSDIVVVKGSREQVEQMRVKLVQAVDEMAEVNHEEVVPAPFSVHEFVLARLDISRIREQTQTRILFPLPDDANNRDRIRVLGPRAGVEAARQMVAEVVNGMGPITTASIDIDPRWRRSLTQRRSCASAAAATNLIGDSAGGITVTNSRAPNPASLSLLAHIAHSLGVRIDLSPGAMQLALVGMVLQVKGPEQAVGAALERIRQAIHRLENTVEDRLLIGYRDRRCLLDQCHKEVLTLCHQYNVEIDIPPLSHALVPDSCSSGHGAESPSSDSTGFASLIKSAPLSPTLNGHPPTITGTGALPLMNGISDITDNGTLSSDVLSEVSSVMSISGMGLPAGGEPGVGGVSSQHAEKQFQITLKGLQEDIDVVKEQLEKLKPVDAKVTVPFDYHRSLIGAAGKTVDEIRRRFGVSISLPEAHLRLDQVTVSGVPDRVAAAKRDIESRVVELDKQRADRAARNYAVVVHVPPRYHSQLIGVRGETVVGLRRKHGVAITVPGLKSGCDEVEIKGYKACVEAAMADVLALIKKLESYHIEELVISPEIHPYLIGSRGSNLDRIKRQFGVEIAFPPRGSTGEEASLVRIKGDPVSVDQCSNYLISEANDWLTNREFRPATTNCRNQQIEWVPSGGCSDANESATLLTASARGGDIHSSSSTLAEQTSTEPTRPRSSSVGFKVRNAPWERSNNNRVVSSNANNNSGSGGDGFGATGPSLLTGESAGNVTVGVSWSQVISASKK